MSEFYKLCIYIPESHLEPVKSALFKAGAGRLGEYDCCAWQSKGEGQFRPSDKATPHLGQANQVETVSEYKVEMLCPSDKVHACLSALKEAHPYETPAYDFTVVMI